MQTNARRKWGNTLFLGSLMLGLILAVTATWADYEAMSYYFNGAGYDTFGSLNCPVLMSRSETATVSATFDNPDNSEITPYYKVDIESTANVREVQRQITVPAH